MEFRDLLNEKKEPLTTSLSKKEFDKLYSMWLVAQGIDKNKKWPHGLKIFKQQTIGYITSFIDGKAERDIDFKNRLKVMKASGVMK